MTDSVRESSGDKRIRRSFADIPCYKNSLLYGISSGIGGGLIYFLFTSKVKHACHASIATHTVVTLSYWTYCRYKWEEDRKKAEMMTEYLRQYIIREGTEQNEDKESVV
ncbi:cytochrome c oxidase protein 20 homolog [Cimex lectularius]|uniref:Cytochrome c oxidase assembly protein COX20, mitochondrial n=1 Tax=Cimex lectularius TaxID=79782 RepID=A0A8I6S0S8_CIMLE|nr:cytochrome c oxidase protein 20 homolog [Cimex lectularius]